MLRIKVHEKDERLFSLTLREYGSLTPLDVSGYTNIYFEWENPSGAAQTPLTLVSTTSGANWASGVVVVSFTASDVTSAVGDYRFGLTLKKVVSGTTTEERTILTGVVEVQDRAADSFTVST